MIKGNIMKRVTLATTVAAVLTGSIGAAAPTAALAQSGTSRPSQDATLSGRAGKMVRLNGARSDLFDADGRIADGQGRPADQIYSFGKAAGETTIYATNKAGRTLYSATVRV